MSSHICLGGVVLAMRIKEQSPKGVNGFSTLFVDSVQLTPWCRSL